MHGPTSALAQLNFCRFFITVMPFYQITIALFTLEFDPLSFLHIEFRLLPNLFLSLLFFAFQTLLKNCVVLFPALSCQLFLLCTLLLCLVLTISSLLLLPVHSAHP